jgi:hypothetical protein
MIGAFPDIFRVDDGIVFIAEFFRGVVYYRLHLVLVVDATTRTRGDCLLVIVEL